MCTAISSIGKDRKKHLFGRTLDVECSFGESVIITPRKFRINMRHGADICEHAAIIGIGIVREGIPLYYDAMNEHGLCAAALNFPQSAVYHEPQRDSLNIASFELIGYVLAKCQNTNEVAEMLVGANITNDSFSVELGATPMHWMVSDKSGSIVLEPREDGLMIHKNPYGVLTNEPPFEQQCTSIADFLHLSASPPINTLYPQAPIKPYSNGMGAIGLPGDFSSRSRFVRAVFLSAHTVADGRKIGEIMRFFGVMDSLRVPRGVVKNSKGRDHFTVYTSCADSEDKVYYFSTCACRDICAVRLSEELAEADRLSVASTVRAQCLNFIPTKFED